MSVQNELIGLSCWLAVSVCQEPSIRQPVVADVFHHLNLKKKPCKLRNQSFVS